MKTFRRISPHINVYPKTTLEKFRQTLLRMRDLTCAELGGLTELIPQESPSGAGSPTEAVGPHLPATQLAVAEAEQTRLFAYLECLESALERLAQGHYGRCVGCGGPIGTGRLEALPCAQRCARCQRELLNS